MVKYVYKVLKKFSITRGLTDKKRIAKSEEEEKHGSTFRKNANYVDYESEERNIEPHPITQKLEDMDYIELINVVNMRS